MAISSYEYDSDSTLDVLPLYTFKGDFNAVGDSSSRGFAFNQFVYERSYGCGNCQANPSETRTVSVSGEPYEFSSEDSDFFVTVQPNSGYMYQRKKDSTFTMVLLEE